MRLPKFVFMVERVSKYKCALRLESISPKGIPWYWRDGGEWGVEGIQTPKGMISKSIRSSINNKKIVKCTKAEWKKSNGQYAPKVVPDVYIVKPFNSKDLIPY